MTIAKSAGNKPAKPRKDYPLFAHRNGQWCKKVKGKFYYFGPWDDPIAAEASWERDKLAILEGRDRNAATAGDSLAWLCNTFMESKKLQHGRGELTKRALNDYHRVAKQVAAHFGKARSLDSIRATDFEAYRDTLPSTWGPTTINNHLRLVRVLFKYANDIEATDRPIRYQLGLKAVSKAVVRKHEAKQPAKEFTAKQIHQLLAVADVQSKAFILLGINCAYGTMDIARLKTADIDFAKSWLGEPRGKTGIARGAWLWPETVAVLREALVIRSKVECDEFPDLAFLTRNKRPFAVDGSTSHPLTQGFLKLKEAAKIDAKGVGHYALRHTFETIAGDSKDQIAVDYVMGHHDQSMAGNYRQGLDPKRVKAVCQHVRKWFLAGKPKPKRKSKPKPK